MIDTATATAPTQKPKRSRRQPATLPPTLHPEQRIGLLHVCALIGVGKTHTYDLLNKGELPKPERYGKRYVRWRAGDVLDYLQRRAAGAERAAA